MRPFVVLSLPRSRSAWLSHFLTYGEHVCGHEELRHMRTLNDVRTWFSQPCIGTAETAAAPWWRLLSDVAPNARVVVVRRSPEAVAASMARFGFDHAAMLDGMRRLDRKLDQIEARMDCLSVQFDDLSEEATARAVWAHCLPYDFDGEHFARLSNINIQINMAALNRYVNAYFPALERLGRTAKHRILANMATRRVVEPAGVTIQCEDCDTWERDGRHLFESHCITVGEEPAEWERKNWPLFRALEKAGALQIMTARSNGRMFGYLMTVIGPSLEGNGTMGAHTTFFADASFPGLGMKLQRAALAELRRRGVDDIHFQAGTRGDGERLGALYRRLGAENAGQVYRLQLTEH